MDKYKFQILTLITLTTLAFILALWSIDPEIFTGRTWALIFAIVIGSGLSYIVINDTS